MCSEKIEKTRLRRATRAPLVSQRTSSSGRQSSIHLGRTLAVPDGARAWVSGFRDPNGAGKSTTINMLRTLARPNSGSARVSGFDVVRERDDVRRHIGLVFQDPSLDGHLTATQNLRLHAELYDIDPAAIS